MARRAAGMNLGAFLYPTGHHIAGWRHPAAQADAGINFRHYVELARTAERGKFDMVFMADVNGAGAADPRELYRLATRYIAQFEPTTLISGLAAATERIGLVATASTTYNEPYHVARRFASLDHISGGRAGWNLVTSSEPAEAQNFGREPHMAHKDRYGRAREFAAVVRKLWDSYDDDAFPRDKEAGVFFDPAKLHILNHNGPHFHVRGPLNIPRPPQGHPVIVQAGSSEEARDLAAETAEVLFTTQPTLERGQAFYADVKRRLAHFGREPDALKILPGAFVVVGSSRQEATDRFEHLQSLIHPELIIQNMSHDLGADLSGYDVDGPVPQDLPEVESNKSQQRTLLDLARRDNLTLRQLHARFSAGRGHVIFIGTAADVADGFEQWYREEGSDGFNVLLPYFPGGLDDFVNLVIPELQRRALFRSDYAGPTLRDHLGLARPPDAATRR